MTDSMHPDNLTTISQEKVGEIRERLDKLNIGDKITLICNSIGGQYEEQIRIESKTYQEGFTGEKFGSWGMGKNEFNPLPRYILEGIPKRKRTIYLFSIGRRIIEFKEGW